MGRDHSEEKSYGRRDKRDRRDDYGSSDRARGKERERDHEREKDRDRDERKSRRRSRSRDGHDSDGGRKRRRQSDERSDEDRKHRRSRSRDKDKDRERDKKRKKDDRKAEKQRLRDDEEARQVAELSVYSAVDNPFHDVNLNQQFKWHKKSEKEKKMGMSVAEARQRDELRRAEAKEELERLNKRRAEREAAQLLREEEEAQMQRLAESAQTAEWIAKEGDFQLEQERRRAGIRLKERRGKAIDFLVLNLKFATVDNSEKLLDDDGLELDEAGMEIDIDEPYDIFNNLTLEQTEELHDDIQRYLTLEKKDVNIEFWTNMMVVCKDKLERLQTENGMGYEAYAAQQRANAAVEKEIEGLLAGRSLDQLNLLQRQVQGKLSSREPIDTDYWENLLKNLLVWKAKARLKALHAVIVQNRLEQLRKRQRDEAIQAQQELLRGVGKGSSSSRGWGGDMHAEMVAESSDAGGARAAMEVEEVEAYDRSMSPKIFNLSTLPPEERQIDIVDELEDRRRLFEARRSVTSSRFVPKPQKAVAEDEAAPSKADLDTEAKYRAEAEETMDEDEEIFNLEEMIENPQTYSWEDKYRPRKPRYFNRVHTGYEWNKYNQTHYDTDNPPPKVVQGYKFNIFYPDLIDKTKAPTYRIVKEPGNEDTCLLCFTAGPPYEDIAFRIVNRDWEYSHKRGFRSSFDRGCLSLWFNFRRNFYRK